MWIVNMKFEPCFLWKIEKQLCVQFVFCWICPKSIFIPAFVQIMLICLQTLSYCLYLRIFKVGLAQVCSLISCFLAHLSWRLKVRYCDHSPSVVVVVRLSVRLSVRPSVRPFTIFKQHLLLNQWLDFDQTSQEWSLVGPLSKLFKWFRSIACLGHRS